MNLLELETQDPVSWCENNITLDYGAFDRENHPLMVEPITAAAKIRGGTVGLIGSVQHIKTLTAQLLHLYKAATAPCRAAHYDLTKEAIAEFSDDKFTPLIDNTDAVTRLIPEQGYRRGKFYTGMPYGFIRLLSARILANRNSKTLKFVSMDESWAYEDGEGWIEQVHDRQASYPWSWSMFLPSSGQTEGSELDVMWKKSTQKVWHIKCDCCGEMIPYVWSLETKDGQVPRGGMRWGKHDEICNDDGTINKDKLTKSIYYECQLCHGQMPWSAGHVARRNKDGAYIQTNKDGDPKIDFYNYNAISHFPWPDLVMLWKDACSERQRGSLTGIENFIRKRLAEPWDEKKYVSTDKIPEASGGYNRGDAWEDAKFLFCTVDVQQDHYYWRIRAWGMVDGKLETRGIDWGKAMSTGEIKDVCDNWNIPQGGLDSNIGCRVFLDGNYNTSQVRRICSENGWMMMRGDDKKQFRHKDGLYRMYSPIQYVDAWEGTGSNNQRYVGQFWFSKLESKNALALVRSIRNPEPAWTHEDDAGPVYEKQINAWARIVRQRKTDGSEFYDWINRSPHDDHLYDCEAMQIVCASMAGLVGVTNSGESADIDK